MSLPPLPASDSKSMNGYSKDPFFKKSSKDFWGEGHVELVEIAEPKKCKHKFIEDLRGYRCKKCNAGLFGQGLSLKQGRLYANGTLIS